MADVNVPHLGAITLPNPPENHSWHGTYSAHKMFLGEGWDLELLDNDNVVVIADQVNEPGYEADADDYVNTAHHLLSLIQQ